MPLKYENIVPWGRNLNEYCKMFDLSQEDLSKKILGCGDGPASFNYEATQKGYTIISIDPVYYFTKEQIEKRIEETYYIVMKETSENADRFIWKSFKDVNDLGRVRMAAMKNFLQDYNKGLEEKRYIPGELPRLELKDNEFDIALSSHFLFLYSDNLSLDFHIEAMEEMLRVSKELRVFPILDYNANLSKHYAGVVKHFGDKGFDVQEVTVDYEFQVGGNKMLRISKM
ncbi:MAG: SAM-dependent methyltransferase [Bacillota bacterium]|nr:SAM-dependent methyltransferase [Bacillota bacterium]